MIQFNRTTTQKESSKYIQKCLSKQQFSSNGKYTIKCQDWFEKHLNCNKTFLTPSCTHALEMAAILIGIKEGDEVIMPSFTFVSTANAFILRGAKVVFVDIRPDTLNIDEKLIEKAISEKTKAIVPVHYAGVACEMDTILDIAKKYNLFVIEDAAQAMMSTYKNKALGTIGHIGAFSFHDTKNYTSAGEGGLLLINDSSFLERAEIIRDKGTNRAQFFRDMIDKYSWVDIGSSYLLSDLNAAYLYGELKNAKKINQNRIRSWQLYYKNLLVLEKKKHITLPSIPQKCEHNGHIFYIKVNDLKERTMVIDFLKKHGIIACFHYVPLHSSQAGLKLSSFNGQDNFTTKESERLIRLPLYYNLSSKKILYICNIIKKFWNL